jgi:hypothetical protein
MSIVPDEPEMELVVPLILMLSPPDGSFSGAAMRSNFEPECEGSSDHEAFTVPVLPERDFHCSRT